MIGDTDFIKPKLTSLRYLDIIVGVLIDNSLDISRKDFLPSFINDLIIATSVLSNL